jgi:hypothetical protein
MKVRDQRTTTSVVRDEEIGESDPHCDLQMSVMQLRKDVEEIQSSKSHTSLTGFV